MFFFKTWIGASENAKPEIISDEGSGSLNGSKVDPRAKCRRERMKHLLAWVVQVNSNMTVSHKPNLSTSCLTPHYCPQSPTSLLACHLIKRLTKLSGFVIISITPDYNEGLL